MVEIDRIQIDVNEERAEDRARIEVIEPKKVVDILDILKILSPGTQLRIAIDDIERAKTGALIVVMSNSVSEILDGGFKVNCRFTPQRLAELCKMDGAVILSDDLKKILYANVLLVPDPSITSDETGTRHKAAEKTAKQADTLVIAVSQRRSKVTIYYANMRHVLKNPEEILRRATENLQILEKQREIYDQLLTNMNVLEVTGLVSISDVCSILQRTEMILRISDIIKKNIVELGKEGNIVKMRLRELLKNVEKTEQGIMRDYAVKIERLKQLLSEVQFDDLLDTEGLSKLLFNKASNESIQSKGYRFLLKLGLDDKDVRLFVSSFKNLNNVLSLEDEELIKILRSQDSVSDFKSKVSSLKESIMMGKKF